MREVSVSAVLHAGNPDVPDALSVIRRRYE